MAEDKTKHVDKISKSWGLLRVCCPVSLFPSDLKNQGPDSQVTEDDYEHRNYEMEHHHGDRVG